MTSRRVALTTAFLTLAAGGTAACDSSSEEEVQDETFYCATDDGTVVDEDNCDNDDDRVRPVGGFFLWHSVAYAAGYATGSKLPPGGSRFAYNDRAARQAYGLPATGPVANGTVKTNVVGQGGDSTSRSKSSGG